MNIDSVGRVRPPKPGEGPLNLLITEKRVHARQGGVSHNFNILYQPEATNNEIFTKTVQPLLELFLAGFNTCVLIYGESGSGKSYTMAGDQGPKSMPGIVPQAINYVLTELQAKSQGLENSLENPLSGGGDVFRLLFFQYEIYNEIITDLMARRGTLSGRGGMSLETEHSPEDGPYVKNLEYERIRTPAEGLSAFMQSWMARNINVVDFGPVKNYSSVVFQMDLSMMTTENPMPNHSKFTVIRLPGAEKLSEDLSRIRLREGPSLSKSIVAFNQLSADLARQPDPQRVVNYSDSKLTTLLEDILGGNCKTRVICCLPPTNIQPDIMAAVLSGCGLLTEVKNFPILNDSLAQNLVTQYRSRINTSLQHGGYDAGAGGGMMSRSELQDQLLRITSDNSQLRERNDRLFQRLEQIQEKLTDLAKSKSELSTRLVASEEEKLKVSKGLVEIQLENNRLSEEYEAENFDLKNKILNLENQMVEYQMERDKLANEHSLTTQHTRHLEQSRKQIADEFVQLKQRTLELQRNHEKQKRRNDDMRAELARLIDTEAALLDLRHNVDKQREVQDAAIMELDRARAVLDAETEMNRNYNNENLEKDVATEVREMRELRHGKTVKGGGSTYRVGPSNRDADLLGNYKLLSMDDDVIKNMKSTYDVQSQKLEQNLIQLRNQLSASYEAVRSANKKCAEQSAALLIAQDGFRRSKDENTKLQQQIKETNQDYRKRLWKYVQDIAEFMDNNQETKSAKKDKSYEAMKKYIDEMMKEMRTAFRSREEQLSNTARNNRKLAKTMIQRHERLLISYRSVREQLESIQIAAGKNNEPSSSKMFPVIPFPIDLGPDESELIVDDKELSSANSMELNRLRQALYKIKAELKSAQNEVERLKQVEKVDPHNTFNLGLTPSRNGNDILPDVGQKIRDYSKSNEVKREKERAELLTRATVAEQQNREQHEYIDIHLSSYKQEIGRLRRILADKGIHVSEKPGPELHYSSRYGGRLLDPISPRPK